MAKGGRTDKTANMPAFAETGVQQTAGVGTDAASTGYTPMYGVDIAGFSPMQTALLKVQTKWQTLLVCRQQIISLICRQHKLLVVLLVILQVMCLTQMLTH